MLVQQALIGTVNAYGGLQGVPDDVKALVPAVEPEQQVLLAAGLLDIFCEAGRKPVQRTLPAPAPENCVQRVVPRHIQSILDECLRGDWERWWPAVAARLARSGYVIAYGRLVSVLNLAKTEQHSAWRPLLGARGMWLAAQNPAWVWAVTDVGKMDRSTMWLEGSIAEREAALRAQRETDPIIARDWLEAVWKGEKAEARQTLLQVLATGLSGEDEIFLNLCLGDRSQAVRATALGLLVSLQTSALAQRLRERAMEWVVWQAPASQGVIGKLAAHLNGSAHGSLRIQPAIEWNKSWGKEGMEETPAQGEGARSFWLRQLVSTVPPALWEQHTGQAPEVFIESAISSDWESAMIEGLEAAILRFSDARWALALHRVLLGRGNSHGRADELFHVIAEEQRYQLCADRIIQGDMNVGKALASCPVPWPHSLNEAILLAVQKVLREVGKAGAEIENNWELIEQAALNLPSNLLAETQPLWQQTIDSLDSRPDDWRARAAATGFRRQLDLIERRLQFDKEIPL